MFYKTTVHSLVPGGVVDSRGKTLTFIGNKVARVGDTIWTDGRVVFGHTPARGSPILAGGDEAIPVTMYNSDDAKFHHYIFKRNFYEIGSSPLSGDRRYIGDALMINDAKSSICFDYTTNTNVGDTYYPDTLWAVANIDKKENVYVLRVGRDYEPIYKDGETADEARVIIGNIHMVQISISKNKESLPSVYVPLGEFGLGYYGGCTIHVVTGFVENENDWAVIVQVDSFARRDNGKKVPYTYTSHVWWEPDLSWHHHTYDKTAEGEGEITDYSLKTYSVTPRKTKLLYEASAQRTRFSGIDVIVYDTYNDERLYPNNRWKVEKEHIFMPAVHLFSQTKNIITGVKIPLPDGYYYTINSYPRLLILRESIFFPTYMEITIFTPEGREILTDTFHAHSYITIKKTASGKYLLGVKIKRHSELSVIHKACEVYADCSGRLVNSYEDVKLDDVRDVTGTYIESNAGEGVDLPNELPGPLSEWALIGHWAPAGEGFYDFRVDRYPANEAILDYLNNTPFVDNGLYLYTPEKGLEKIAQGVCINQRLRAMPRRRIKAENFTFNNDLVP